MPKNDIEIIFQNTEFLVVNKPSGISVTADRCGAEDLLSLLTDQLQACGPSADEVRPRIVHRLDKDTSGVLVIAKTASAQTVFSRMFEDRQVQKVYLALVSGYVPGKSGTISASLMQDPKDSRLVRVAARGGKAALTDWRLLADFGTTALLAVIPLTGRTHQIRVHLAHVGMPLLVDPLYGSAEPLFLSQVKTSYRQSRKKEQESPLVGRLTLHAYQLTFPVLPDGTNSQGSPSVFVARVDRKFAAAVKMLTKHNPKGPAAFVDPAVYENIMSAQPF